MTIAWRMTAQTAPKTTTTSKKSPREGKTGVRKLAKILINGMKPLMKMEWMKRREIKPKLKKRKESKRLKKYKIQM